MPRPTLVILGFVILAVLLVGVSAIGQSADRIEVFGGYSYTRPDFSLVNPNDSNGWNASADFKVKRWVGFVADVSGFYPHYSYPYGSSFSGQTYTFLFGPQASLPVGRFSLVSRFLVGFTHVTPQNVGGQSFNLFQSNNALAFGAGGGADYYITRRVGIRGQVDWLYAKLTPIGGGDPGVNYVKNRNVARISTGVVFRF